MGNETDKLRIQIKKIIARVLEVDEPKIDSEANLVQDLGADSMLILEIMVSLDKEFHIEISEEKLPKMTNLHQIVEIVSELVKK